MDTTSATTVHTVGHGTLPAEDFASLVRDAGVERIVDIRSYPGSRHNPQHAREQLATWLPEAGVAYSWCRALGGRRRRVEGSPHVALRHQAFRAYADHMDTPEFAAGVDDLLALGEGSAVLCSESVWWRCHRRLLADHLVLVRGVEVVHLMHDGRRTPHRPTEGVRLDGDRLRYDAGEAALPGLG